MYYAPVLARGKLHVVMLGESFPGDMPEGMAELLGKVRAAINVRFHGDDKPNVLMTDKGQGFYRIKSSKITPHYDAALREHGFSAFMGVDATRQPGDLKDLTLYETAVAWLDKRLTLSTPAKAWEETLEAFEARLRQACEHTNNNFNVEGLCWELPDRLRDLQLNQGGRLKK